MRDSVSVFPMLFQIQYSSKEKLGEIVRVCEVKLSAD